MFRLIFVILWWGTLNNHYNECIVHMCIWYNCFPSKVDNHLKWRIACLIYSGMQTYCSSNYINLILCFYFFGCTTNECTCELQNIKMSAFNVSTYKSAVWFALEFGHKIINSINKWFIYYHRNSNTISYFAKPTHLSSISNYL